MKKWLLLLIAIIAAAFIASPTMGYISVKYTYDGIYDGWCIVTLDQHNPGLSPYPNPDWYIVLQRAPNGPITHFDDRLVPIEDERQTDRTFNVWTEYWGQPDVGFVEEPVTQFYTYPGYDVYVTVVPVLDKMFFVPQ